MNTLVKAGAGVNVTDYDGRTCLFLAARNGHTETVRYLVGLPEVDVNHRDMYNCTALDCATNKGHADVVRVIQTGWNRRFLQQRRTLSRVSR